MRKLIQFFYGIIFVLHMLYRYRFIGTYIYFHIITSWPRELCSALIAISKQIFLLISYKYQIVIYTSLHSCHLRFVIPSLILFCYTTFYSDWRFMSSHTGMLSNGIKSILCPSPGSKLPPCQFSTKSVQPFLSYKWCN